jgi:hypothetical protein
MALDGANLFSLSHGNCEKLKDSHHPKPILKTAVDSQTYVGISIILCLQLLYISRNIYIYI